MDGWAGTDTIVENGVSQLSAPSLMAGHLDTALRHGDNGVRKTAHG